MNSTNLWRRLRNLYPGAPQMRGQVISVDGQLVRIQDDNGQVTTARGAASVGQYVFHQAGVIQGLASSLTLIDIEV